MSLRSSNRIEKEKSRNYADDSVSDAGSIPDAKLQDKVVQLEDTLKKFRAEVDMKMSIMQQILSTRNEMFAVQKKLIEREQALHETVLSHWKNIPDLAATGLSLKFTDDGDNDVNVRVFDNEGGEKHKRSGFAGLGKRHSSSAARRDRKKKAKTKYRGDSDSENEESGFNADPEEDPIAVDTFGDTEDHDTTGGADEDNENDAEDPNMERKVFVNYYSEEPAKPGQLVTKTPIWKYYLREETGDSALCKLCDENGVQTILKVKKGHGTSCLHKHLKFKHGDYAVDLTPMKKEMDGTGTPETSTGLTQRNRKKLLFENHWHLLDKILKSGREYWKCTDRTCKGRLVIRPDLDLPPEVTGEHTCMSTEVDVGSSQLMSELKHLALTELHRPPSELIKKVKEKYTPEVCKMLAEDANLARTVRRWRSYSLGKESKGNIRVEIKSICGDETTNSENFYGDELPSAQENAPNP